MKPLHIAILFGLLLFPSLRAPGAETPATPPQARQFLTTEMAASITQGWLTTRTDASITGARMSIAGRRFRKGLGTHAPGEMVFKLNKQHKQFTALVGVDDAAPKAGSVEFKVLVDGKDRYHSGIVKWGQPARPVSVDVTGADELRLACTNAGDGVQGDHADWAEASIDGDAAAAAPLAIPQTSTAGFFAIPGSPRQVFNFNPGWRFRKGDPAGAEKAEFDDSAWEGANLPHGLEILGENASGMRNYQGPAWYRKRFTLPESMKGKKATVYFEAVMGKAAVWVNGRKAAEHFGGYLPFAIELDNLNTDGRSNVIAVRADNSDDPSYPPGKPQGDLDFTYLGGIYRDVFLIATDPVRVTFPELSASVAGGGVFVATKDVNGRDAQLEVRTEVANGGAEARKLTLRTVLEDAAGRELLSQETPADVAAGGSKQLTQTLAAQGVHLWHPDDPYLHFIRTEVVADGRVLDSLRTRFGIRLFEMRGNGGLYVNKQPIGHKLSGVNRHQDYVYVGNALPNSGQWRDARLLREGGSNIVRAAHYPLDPAFMDACDELGLLVTVPNPGWQFFNDKDPRFEQRIYQDTRAMVRRDRNRPAVLLWETGLNETDNQPLRLLKEMHRLVHEEFPFPGAFTCTDVDKAKAAGMDFYYHGGMDEEKCSLTREYGDGGEVDNFFSHNAMVRVKREWGEHALLNQARIRVEGLDEIYGTPPKRLGATLWAGIDHQRGYHPDPFWGGLLDVYRLPRYSYFLFKSQYDPGYKLPGIATGPMVSIAHELTQVSEPDVMVFTNCEQVRLTWLGKVIGTQAPEANYKHMPHPPVIFRNVFDYHVISSRWRGKTHEIEMVAEGLIGGKVVCREVKKYPERTTGIRLEADAAGVALAADGSDFIPVRATVVDNKGVAKVLASEEIHFEVEGAGELIGGAFNQANPMKTQFGVATALVRAGRRPGAIKIKATSPGLDEDEIVLTSSAPALPLLYDEAYVAETKGVAAGTGAEAMAAPGAAAPDKGKAGDAAELNKLKAENRRLQLELTSREQDIMELKSRLSGGHKN